MFVSHNPSSHVVWGIHLITRVVRTVAFGVLAHPLALVVMVFCLWLLTQMASNAYHLYASGSAWSVSEALSCGAFMMTLVLLACLAAGYVGLMLIVGWSETGRDSLRKGMCL